MRFPLHKPMCNRRAEKASVLIIVMWIAIGLIAITLYFANSMTLELRASDNRTSGMAADQAIEGAARYVSYVLANYATNGAFPTNAQFTCQNMPIGDARVWIIGRDESTTASTPSTSTDPAFGLIDEASKLNLNTAGTNTLAALPNMDYDLAEAIVDWRSTNSTLDLNYGSLGYDAKHWPFETVDELRLVYGMTLDDLVGDDLNRNGILDGSEKSSSGDTSNPGLIEYTTVYSREPTFDSDGSSLTNVNVREQIEPLLESTFGETRAGQIIRSIGYLTTAAQAPTPAITSVLQFYTKSGLSADDFGQIADDITATTNQYVYGRVNINTASEAVLTALFEGVSLNIDQGTAQSAADTLINYREQNPNSINNISWFVTALGQNNSIVTAMAGRDRLTTKSYQFTADIAAVGPYGRGYRRVKFVFDTTDGTPKILYRQDLSRLGWALGPKVRETLLAQNTQ
jgi:DNA uptake protein ComE-like DNA-binding protein